MHTDVSTASSSLSAPVTWWPRLWRKSPTGPGTVSLKGGTFTYTDSTGQEVFSLHPNDVAVVKIRYISHNTWQTQIKIIPITPTDDRLVFKLPSYNFKREVPKAYAPQALISKFTEQGFTARRSDKWNFLYIVFLAVLVIAIPVVVTIAEH